MRPSTSITGLAVAAALGVLSWSIAALADDVLAGANAARGKALVEKSCTSCHASLYGGDGTKIYSRPDRTVKSVAQLIARVKICNVNAGAGWHAADEFDAAAYLNQTFYRLK